MRKADGGRAARSSAGAHQISASSCPTCCACVFARDHHQSHMRLGPIEQRHGDRLGTFAFSDRGRSPTSKLLSPAEEEVRAGRLSQYPRGGVLALAKDVHGRRFSRFVGAVRPSNAVPALRDRAATLALDRSLARRSLSQLVLNFGRQAFPPTANRTSLSTPTNS